MTNEEEPNELTAQQTSPPTSLSLHYFESVVIEVRHLFVRVLLCVWIEKMVGMSLFHLSRKGIGLDLFNFIHIETINLFL